MHQPIIACDVDDVVANLIGEWLRRYNERYDDSLTPGDIHSWDIDRWVKPECGKKVFELLGEPDLYTKVEPFPQALETIEWLREAGRVVFVTSCGGTTRDAKYKWLRKHGFLRKDQHGDYITAKDKWLIKADVLIDDAPHNVADFMRFGGRALLVSRPHNEGFDALNGVRLRSFQDAPAVVARLLA